VIVLPARRRDRPFGRLEFLVDAIAGGWDLQFLECDLVNTVIQRHSLKEHDQRVVGGLLGREGEVGLAVRCSPVLVGIKQEPDPAVGQIVANQQVDDVNVARWHDFSVRSK
jgi:hypothetical protein